MKLTRILHFILIFFFPLLVLAQEKVSLLDIIPDIETKFDVKFSYSTSEVQPILVERPSDSETLSNIIDRFNATTLLNFKFLTERYITISSIDKTISVCGSVITKENDALFGASVVVLNTTNGSVSSEDGQFSLNEVPVNSKIVISFIGFETKEFNAVALWRHKGCKDVQLNEKSELLNQVIISKFLTTGLQKSIDGNTVLNTEAFGTLPGLIEPDILQTIQVLPGVESVNESIANINVRGGTNDQNLMLWDGIKMYHSGHFFGLISAYNPYLTEKVVVSKNGTSSEFSDGVSSTVDMKTKNEVNDNFSGGFGANLLHADALLEVPIGDKLAFHFSGRRSFTDVFTSPTYENYFERSFQDSEIEINSENINESSQSSDFSFYDFTAKLLFNLNDNHQFRVNVIGINNDLDYSEVNTNNSNEAESKTSNLRQENLGVGGSWKASWSDRFITQLSGYYSKYIVDATDLRVETNQLLTQSNEVLETGLKFKSDFRISKTLNLLNGYQFTEVGILNETTVENPDYERTKKDVLLNHAAFTEVEFNNGKTYIRAGVRANYFQKFSKLIVEPRLNVRQKLSSSFVLKLQGEFKNQSATQIIDFQDDFLGVENRRWILANEQNIPISESKQGSFGIAYNRNNFLFDVEGFYKHVDGITVSNQGFYNNFQFINAIGSYDVKGVETMISKTAEQFSTWLSYTYSINNYEFKTLTPSVFPNNVDIRHSVSMGFNYNVMQNLEISVGGIWRSGQPFTKPVEGNETVQDGNSIFVNYDTPNSKNLDDFMRLDASMNYSFNLTDKVRTSIRMGIINLLDRENSINTYYEVDPNDSNRAIEVKNKSLGLTPNISVRCIF
ncbi:carboxypeptidase-like regulatory domain-containing protein [Winogradskyella sp.]|uniref:TonB-dependent receptor n=1 Tax=Winogradskyella sp. TaxID=1883156 RepID=UPI003519A159